MNEKSNDKVEFCLLSFNENELEELKNKLAEVNINI
jgi:hypothetical protein